MALHKLNVLHWHLTDDQAWRLEIKKYPRLTSVGGWRVPAGRRGASRHRRGDRQAAPVRRFLHAGPGARDRGARRRRATSPWSRKSKCPDTPPPRWWPTPGSVSTDNPPKAIPEEWGIFPTLFNVDDSTFTFLEDVLTETMALFPGEYIHVGGDEALKDEWHASPKVQARMKELGVKDEHALQSYFIQRMEKFLSSKGRKLIGWDEILEGGLRAECHRDVLARYRRRDRGGQGRPRHGAVAGAGSVSRSLAEPGRYLSRPQQHAVAQGCVPVQSGAGIDRGRTAQTHSRTAGKSLGGDDAFRGARDLHGVPARRGARGSRLVARRTASTGTISRNDWRSSSRGRPRWASSTRAKWGSSPDRAGA